MQSIDFHFPVQFPDNAADLSNVAYFDFFTSKPDLHLRLAPYFAATDRYVNLWLCVLVLATLAYPAAYNSNHAYLGVLPDLAQFLISRGI